MNDDEDIGEPQDLALLRRLKREFRDNAAHWNAWRKEARMSYDMLAGRHWTAQEESELIAAGRQPIVFNRILAMIKSVAGIEINSRQEIQFIPRERTDSRVAEVLSSANQFIADQTEAEDEQSEAFQDAVICGMGWTESRLDFDDNPDGDYVEQRIDPLEMFPDLNAARRNLTDARNVFRVREIALKDARAMFPGIPDPDLNATWVNIDGDNDGADKSVEERREKRDENGEGETTGRRVTIVQAQWWEREAFFRIADGSGREIELTPAQFRRLKARSREIGIEPVAAKAVRKKFKQAFIGNKILSVGDAPIPNRFSFQVITGERDRNKKVWFGLVRTMHDPQKWANKWLVQVLHILNSTAKGGILAEKGAFDDERQAEESYARPNAITWLTPDAISGRRPKIQEKPAGSFPAGFWTAMEFAISSIRDVTGINLELLGLRDANQPGILEAQRKQAAMTILATLFDSLRRYRKQIGKIRLFYIQEHLSDGRFIRIVGEEQAEVVPLAKEQVTGKFDVIVDDAPASPNMKERNWQVISSMLPAFKDLVTPEIALAILEYSPIPTALIDKIKESAQQAPDESQQIAEQMAMAGQQAEVDKRQASARLDTAKANKTDAETAALAFEAITTANQRDSA